MTLKSAATLLVLVGVLAAEAQATEPFLPADEVGPIERVERRENFVILHARRASIRLSFVTDSILRIFMDPYRRFEDRPSAKYIMDGTKYQTAAAVAVEETDTTLALSNPRLRVVIEKRNPVRIGFETSDGRLLTRIVKPILTGAMHSDYHRVRFQIAPDENFYGLGERFHSFNHRGREIVLRNVDVINQPQDYNYFSIPFFLSSHGYGIFYNNTWETRFRFGSDFPDELSLESPGPNCDLFFIFGPTPKEVLKNYLFLTGLPPLIPRYALGLWLGDFPYENQERIPRIGQEFIDHQLPWDNFYLDYEWANTFFDFRFSAKTTPNREVLTDWFRAHHRQLALIETPYINAECPLYREALERKLFCDPLGAWWHTERGSGQVDFSNPEAARWWWGLHEPLVKAGISFFVTDDGEFTRAKALDSDGVTGAELHNYYALLYTRGMFEAMEKSSNPRAFICSRSAFAGSQKYGSFFAGDQDTNYRNLLKVTRASLSSGLSGMPLLRTDLAGLFGELDPERYARFIESQALHPMLMLFTYIPSNVSSNKYKGKLDRRPWTYGDATLEIFRKYLQLRHSLVPYLYTLAAEARSAGAPIVRPLLYEYPQDPEAWGIEDEYLVGLNLLIAPVMAENTFSRTVYLPKGTDWVDFRSDHIYTGGQKINYAAPINILPLFVRRGSILPLEDPLLTLVDHPYPELTWRIYPSSQAERFVLYEDDGLTQEYKQGKVVRTEVSVQGGEEVEIRIRTDAQRERKHTLEVHLLARKPKAVTLGGKPLRVRAVGEGPGRGGTAPAAWDESRKALTIVLPSLSQAETVVRIE